jgi:hypothetical protein
MFDKFYTSNIEEACKLSRTRYLWVLNDCCDYSDFDFTWEPVPWESNQIHIWPSQHQENSGTMLVPKQGAIDKNYNHSIVKRTGQAPRLHIKHTPSSPDQGDINTRYISDYLGTMRRALKKTNWEYCWVTSDVCIYDDFDFSWHPSEFQSAMLHVFASGNQKFGDTFYVHVPSFLEKTENLKVLEWFETLHFVEEIYVLRQPTVFVPYQSDSVVSAVWEYDFQEPYAVFHRHDYGRLSHPNISLWQERTKTVVPLANGSTSVLIPREVKNHIKTQIYDYPWINKDYPTFNSELLDIVFISNGESNAERNWEHLCRSTQHIQNRVVRVDGVKGRAEAYRAALEESTTDWAFCVFAKLEVNTDFDWSWQPDRLQEAKHYIFHAENPVNGLVYGHMAMIAYNKRLVAINEAQGLDFTLDQAHEVVPVLSGIARYADDPWIAWRSAFRECLKLKDSLPNLENNYRLSQWLKAPTASTLARWSSIGAQDAVDYYESVNGDFDALRLTYEWDWLAEYLVKRHNLTPDQLCTRLQDHLAQDI